MNTINKVVFAKSSMKIMLLGLGVLLLALIGVAIKPYSSSPLTPRSSKTLQVVVSFYPLYFFASQIGGDKAEINTITPAGAQAHDYEPTAKELIQISTSDMLILNGETLEPWGDKIKHQLQGSHVLTIIAGEGLAKGQRNEHGKTIQDPHVWLDPLFAKGEVSTIEKGFETIDPVNRAYFQQHAKALEDSLDQLDRMFAQGLSHCRKKDFVTSHAAFGYLAARYGIHQVAISGLSPDEEPSSQTLAEIASMVKREQITIIFFESLVSPKLSQTIANETGAKTLALDPIEGVTEADLNAGRNYLTIMRDNLANLKAALQCGI